MARKYCSRKESCIVGNVLQDYNQFYRDMTSKDGYKHECISCMAARRKERVMKKKDIFDDQFKLFIG